MKRKENLNTDQDWFEAIRECRAGSLSDRDWCEVNGISRNSLYYHIKKLRNKGYYIPKPARTSSTCTKQEVIPLVFNEEIYPPENCQINSPENTKIAASVLTGNLCINIHDGASGATIRDILSALGGLPC